MMRTLCYQICQNVTLKSIQKPFLETNSRVKMNFNRSKLYSSCFCSAYCVNDENKLLNKFSIPLYTTGCTQLHTDPQFSASMNTATFSRSKISEAFYKINMVDLKQAPLPAFWLGMCGLVPIMFPPLSSLLIGYSNGLTTVQYLYAATLLSCMGGIKWGSLIENKASANWYNYTLSIMPCAIATIALMLPKFLGFFVLICGFLTAFVIDLMLSTYPVWFITLRGVLTNISVFFLFISMIQRLFH